MLNTYTYSNLYTVDNGVTLFDIFIKDPVIRDYRRKFMDDDNGMFSPKFIDLAKEMINQDSANLVLRKDVKDFLSSPEFDKEMTEIQNNIGLNPDDTISMCTECLVILGSMYDLNLCKNDKGMLEFLIKYTKELNKLGYKDMIEYTLDKYSKYFIFEKSVA